MIRVLDRAVSIVNAVAHGNGRTLVDISKEVGLPSNTTLRIIASLVSHGVVEQDSQKKVYRLGRRILSWSIQVPYPPSLVEMGLAPLRELSWNTGEDVGLAVLRNGNADIIHKVMGPEPLKIIDSLNTVVPLHCGAFRKVLLAYQEETWINAYLDSVQYIRFTDTTILDRETIEDTLASIRQQEFCYSKGEYFTAAAGLAVPVFGLYGEFLASVFIVGPNMRLTETRVPSLIEGLQKAAKAITRRIRGEEDSRADTAQEALC